MTKRPKRRPHGARAQAKAGRRRAKVAGRLAAEKAATLAKQVQERLALRRRAAGLKEIGAELHEPRTMTPETRSRRRGRRAER